MFDADRHHWEPFDSHRLELAVTGSQARLCPVVLFSRGQDLRTALHHYPAELAPVVIVMVGNDSDERILPNVGDTLERRSGLFLRLLVDAEIHRVPRHHEADGYHVGVRAGIRGGQACNPLPG